MLLVGGKGGCGVRLADGPQLGLFWLALSSDAKVRLLLCSHEDCCLSVTATPLVIQMGLLMKETVTKGQQAAKRSWHFSHKA